MARGNLEIGQIMHDIRSARMGNPSGMPSVYRRLAAALRAGELTAEEVEFIATRLEAVANAVPGGGIGDDKRAKTNVAHALLLARGRAKTTAFDSETLSLQRAYAMKELIDRGLDPKDAAEQLAQKEVDKADPSAERHAGSRAFADAWNFWESGFVDGLDFGPDTRV